MSNERQRRLLVIDCDPGQDDMAAIALACAHPSLQILAITTVSGNAPVEQTTRNALDITAALQQAIPVHRGAAAPLLHRYAYPEEFHGPTGLGTTGAAFPTSPSAVQPTPAAQRLIELIDAHPHRLTIVAIAPMTNLAVALTMRPDLAQKIEEIVFMGGSTGRGNVTAAAEFNIWADPEAAAVVLRSGARLTMFGLNVTELAMFASTRLERVRLAGGSANPLTDAMQFYFDTHFRFVGARAVGAPIHDVCPVAYLLDPGCFEFEALPVEVVTQPGPAYGMTLVDQRERQPTFDTRARNVHVAMRVDQAKLADLVEQALCWAASKISTEAT